MSDTKNCCTTCSHHEHFDENGDEEYTEDELWFNEHYPNACCHRCDVSLDGKTVVYCGGGGGACETWYCAACHEEGTDDCDVCLEEESDEEKVETK